MLHNPSFGVWTMSPKKSSSFNLFSTSVIIFIRCRNCHHIKNYIRYKGNINNTSVIIFLIGTFAFGTLLGRSSRRFWWCWLFLLLFSSLEVFTFPGYFFLPPTLHSGFSDPEGFQQLWALPWPLSVALLLPGFFVTVLPLGVQAFFTLRSFPRILASFVTQMRQEHAIQHPHLCLPSQSCPFLQTHELELLILKLQDLKLQESKLNFWICFACSKP